MDHAVTHSPATRYSRTRAGQRRDSSPLPIYSMELPWEPLLYFNSQCKRAFTLQEKKTFRMGLLRRGSQLLQKGWSVTLAFASGCLFVAVLFEMSSNMKDEEVRYRIRGPLKSDDPNLIDFVKKFYLQPPSPLPFNPTSSHKREYMEHSRGDTWKIVHFFLEKLFSDEPHGFFVEAGALDGEYLSNTLWLERNLGWTGLLIEPEENNFSHLLSKHRKAWLSNSCISSKTYPKESVYVSQMLRDGPNSDGVAWNHRGSAHEIDTEIISKDSWFSMIATEFYSLAQCFPLDTFLLALNITTVDFLSLDIQGHEKKVLMNFPFELFNVRVVAVEIFEREVDRGFVNFMENKGYEFVNRLAVPRLYDHIYVKKDDIHLMNKLKRFYFKW